MPCQQGSLFLASTYLVRQGLLRSLFPCWIMGEHNLHLDAKHTYNVMYTESRWCKELMNMGNYQFIKVPHYFILNIRHKTDLVWAVRVSRHCRCSPWWGCRSGSWIHRQTSSILPSDLSAFRIQSPRNPWHRFPWWNEVRHSTLWNGKKFNQ